MSWRTTVLAAAAWSFLLLGSAGAAQAHPRRHPRVVHDPNCAERIHREEHKLDRDIRRHGAFSRQAQRRREKIHRLREKCGFGFFGRGDRRGGREGRWHRRDDDGDWRDDDRWRRRNDDWGDARRDRRRGHRGDRRRWF